MILKLKCLLDSSEGLLFRCINGIGLLIRYLNRFLFNNIFLRRHNFFFRLHFCINILFVFFDFKQDVVKYQFISCYCFFYTIIDISKSSISEMSSPAKEDLFTEGIAIAIIVLNCISLVSLILVLGVYIINWKAISSFPLRLSFYLCLSCLGQCLTVIILNPITLQEFKPDPSNSNHTSPYCIFDAVLKVTFDLSSIVWTSLIIVSVYCSIATKIKLEELEILFLLIGYLLPILSACVPIFFKFYQYDTYNCWFQQSYSKQGLVLRLGYYFIPLWVFFFINMTLSILTYIKLKHLGLPEQILNNFKKIVLFPLILFFTGIFGTVDLIYNYVHQKELIWLNDTGLLILSLYGFFNAIAYGFNPLIRERIRIFFQKESNRMSDLSDIQNRQTQKKSRNSSQIQAQLLQMSLMRTYYQSSSH